MHNTYKDFLTKQLTHKENICALDVSFIRAVKFLNSLLVAQSFSLPEGMQGLRCQVGHCVVLRLFLSMS